MKDVADNRTKLGDNFISKHIVSLHFAEEARIQVSMNDVFKESDANRLSIVGIDFLCIACHLEKMMVGSVLLCSEDGNGREGTSS